MSATSVWNGSYRSDKSKVMKKNRVTAFVPFAFCLLGAFFAYGASPSGGTKGHGRVFDDPDAAMVRLIRAEEVRSALSYRNDDDELVASNKHVLKLVFKMLGTATMSTSGGLGGMPEASSTSTGSTTSSTTATTAASTAGGHGGMAMLEELPPPATGSTTAVTGSTTTSATTSTTTGTTGTTGAPEPDVYDNFYLWVENPAEMAPIGSRTPTLVPSAVVGVGVPAGVGIEFYPGEEVVAHIASTGALSGTSITVTVETLESIHFYDDPSTSSVDEEHWEFNSYYQTVTYDITKYLCNQSSVDTRKAYGTPNREGDLPDDPNADPAELNFGNWVWKGGLFVGNLPWQSRDMSGCARAQLYPQDEGRTTAPRLAALTMFYTGALPSANGSVTLGAYAPDSSDTNLDTSSAVVSWPTRWDIQPRTTPGSPRDPSKDPMYRVAFTSNTLAGEYANWQLTDVTWNTSTTPSTIFKGVGVAIEDEADYLTNSQSAWRYFASAQYPSVFSSFPETDSTPRLWVVDFNSQTTWSHYWGGTGW